MFTIERAEDGGVRLVNSTTDYVYLERFDVRTDGDLVLTIRIPRAYPSLSQPDLDQEEGDSINDS